VVTKKKIVKERIRLSLHRDGNSIEEENFPSIEKKKRNAFFYLGYVGEIGFVIAIPIVGGVLLGSYLDRIWHTYPTWTMSLLFFGIFVSIVNFIHTVQDIIKHS